jgi:2-haloacid dehalogenase
MVAGAFALLTAPVVAFARTSDNPKRRGARESGEIPVRYFSNSVGEREDVMEADKYEVLSFDCYGTLVDWESGIISGLRPVLRSHGVEATDEEILDLHARTEHGLQATSKKGAYLKYRDVLGEEVREAGRRWGFHPSLSEVEALPDSVRYWLPFPDTVNALRALKGRYRLAIISNIDDGLFALTARYLEVEFDYIVTAEQAGTYKPSPENFELALDRIGVAPGKLLHVAESLFHDHVPAKRMGLDTVWVHRRAAKGGFGATPPAEAEPDLEVPDLESLVHALGSRGTEEDRS